MRLSSRLLPSPAALLALLALLAPPARAQTEPLAQKAAAVQAMRASMPTQAQREAAAAELAAFKARILQARRAAQKSGVLPPAGSRYEALQASAGGVAQASAQIAEGVAPPGPGGVPDYFTTANWAFSPPLRKFVDTLPGLTAANANDLGNFIPVATPDTTSYPGSDYYEIEVRQYQQQLHADLAPTTLRGYRQTNLGTDAGGQNTVAPPARPYFLGPIIVAERDRPVRIKFTNNLPAGSGGDLFVPVDESIMGSGKGPLWPASAYGQPDPATGNPIDASTPCDPSPVQSVPPGSATPGQPCAVYPQNRAAIHLHGGRTPWISDGTPHQWIIPAGEWPLTPYKEGVSLENVPDMPNPGPGSTTYYLSNQQSARLMFYHDHAWGITRLNVLVGMAAGYLIQDQFERALVASGAIPAEQIPLVIQDRTFVASDIRETDPTWNWGTGAPADGVRPVVPGDLWIPHVYVPAQNPYDPTGVNPFGRWVYGPWFFPPTTNLYQDPKPNPYHDPACSDPDPAVFAFCTTPGQPPVMPGTPIPSVGAETFFDTALVNGTAFPSLTVQPRAYRFRILNAANDRFWNLNLYRADPAQVAHDGRTLTEVKMLPAAVGAWDAAAYPGWPADGRVEGVPDPATQGPPFIHFGSEGGFTPRPAVIPAQPITFVTDPTAFNVGNVKDFGLFLGPAERADVVVDFSQYAGQTLILYNDAPAAVPAFDPRHDFLAGAPDLSATGGYGRVPPWSTTGQKEGPQVGYGPNTRTVMQIKVAPLPEGAPAPAPFDLAALEAAFAPSPGKPGLFEAAQDPILVGQAAYNGVYTGVTFPQVWPSWGLARIQDSTLNFKTVGGTYQTFPMEPKGMHDEMGAAFDMEYGRMAGQLGMTNPNRVVGMLNLTVYRYPDPATEILSDAMTPLSPVLGDGTQLWKISHNGVDTHPIHFHVFDVQLINRVGWDGQIRLPHPTELGWKDTVRVSPLEDTIVAMRPWAPKVPFGVPSSLRPLNPAIPLNSPFGFTNIDPLTQQPKVPADVNRVENFGWEYVWHCHILSHEENDMMRPIVLNVVSGRPGSPSPLAGALDPQGRPLLSWYDATPVDYEGQTNFGNPANEIAFRVERSPGVGGPFATVGYGLANSTSYTDETATPGGFYRYRVTAYNEGGAAGSNTVEVGTPPAVPPAETLSLAASPASPFLRDVLSGPTAFTASATGGTGVYEYRFSLAPSGGPMSVVQPYGASPTWSMPVTTPAGSYTVQVEVRTSSAVEADVVTAIPYDLSVPAAPSDVLLSADPLLPSPGFVGAAVTFTAAAQGSPGPFLYRFSLASGGGPFATVRDWAAGATWALPATTPTGAYQVRVEALADPAAAPVAATADYQVAYRPATTLSLRASAAGPWNPAATAPPSFLGTGGGSAGTPTTAYQYRFSLSDNGADFAEVQPWSSSRVWAMPASTPGGSYTVRVEVRTNPFGAADRSATVGYVVRGLATGLTLTPSAPSPQLVGATVTLTAEATGGFGGYQYRFYRAPAGAAGWTLLRDWAAGATIAVDTSAGGSFTYLAEVRTATSGGRDRYVTLPFAIKNPPATGVTFQYSPAGQALTNSVATVTATATSAAPGLTFHYRFWRMSPTGVWSLAQDFSTAATHRIDTSTPGTYRYMVDATTNPPVVEARNQGNYQIAPPPATGLTITSSATSPQPRNAPVTFTVAASSTVAGLTFEYQFYVATNGGPYVLARNWGTGDTFALPTGTAGSYRFFVNYRTVGRTSYRDGYGYRDFVISP